MILDKKEDLKENQAFYDVFIKGMDKTQNQYLIEIKYDGEIRSFYCAEVDTINFYKEFIYLISEELVFANTCVPCCAGDPKYSPN